MVGNMIMMYEYAIKVYHNKFANKTQSLNDALKSTQWNYFSSADGSEVGESYSVTTRSIA